MSNKKGITGTVQEIYVNYSQNLGSGEIIFADKAHLDDYVNTARANERQAMLDAVPEKASIPENVEPIETAKRLDDFYRGFNQAIDQMESAIKLMGGEK